MDSSFWCSIFMIIKFGVHLCLHFDSNKIRLILFAILSRLVFFMNAFGWPAKCTLDLSKRDTTDCDIDIF